MSKKTICPIPSAPTCPSDAFPDLSSGQLSRLLEESAFLTKGLVTDYARPPKKPHQETCIQFPGLSK